jgi:hypothetical protein
MIEVSKCVICDGEIRQLKRALVAPFLAKRIWNRKAFLIDLVKCAGCGFMFYNPRLDNRDLQALYKGYRSQEYQQMRNHFEPWYSAKMNTELASPDSYEKRRAIVAANLKGHLASRTISKVLDHGGDRGDLVAGLIDGATAYVYDISGVNPAPGVIAVSDPSDCQADLIVNSNVLEHVGYPRELAHEIFNAAPKGGLVYLEVPSEEPISAYRLTRRLAQIGVTLFVRPGTAAPLLQPAALYLMHEHINYFTEKSLVTLMRNAGGNVIASGTYDYSGAAGRTPLAWCLGSRAA